MEISVNKLCLMIGDFKKSVKSVIDDVLFTAGALLISFGVYQIYVPAGHIALGVFLMIAAVIWTKGAEDKKNDTE